VAAKGSVLEVAVVGAGLAGLACAGSLRDRGHAVTIFEKSRGPGGRASTRHEGPLSFDHGAQYFTVRDPEFQRIVDGWHELGVAVPWRGRVSVLGEGGGGSAGAEVERWVGVPGMSALGRQLASELAVRYGTRVAELAREGTTWRLAGDGGVELGRYQAVVVSAPPAQTAALLEQAAPLVAARLSGVQVAPCWAVMAAFPRPLGLPFSGAFVAGGSPLAWVACDSSKPGRGSVPEAWVLHASPGWSAVHLEDPSEPVAGALLQAFSQTLGRRLDQPFHLRAHRWRYALPEGALAERCLVDETGSIVMCGDWCGGPRIEGAVLSGLAAASALAAG